METCSKLVLKMDFRERQSGVALELKKYDDELTIEMANLRMGDYNLADQLIIERKTLSDFLQSIKDGRLFRQAYQMAFSSHRAVIIIEGDDAHDCHMKREAIQGALVHLNVILGIPLIRSHGIGETAQLIHFMAEQWCREKTARVKPPIVRRFGHPLSKRNRQKMSVLQMLPHIGCARALELLQKFGTIRNVINQQPTELHKTKGIGEHLANEIVNFVNEPFGEVMR
ncbi:MAG: nuclease [Calditrichaeota bacterium]|nr:MAG: nuclease [Calditrichota bacterium]